VEFFVPHNTKYCNSQPHLVDWAWMFEARNKKRGESFTQFGISQGNYEIYEGMTDLSMSFISCRICSSATMDPNVLYSLVSWFDPGHTNDDWGTNI
jgi:hypothetical protein